MAAITNSNNNLTLADWAKRLDPNGTVPIIAELLSQTNEVLEDAVFKEGNLPNRRARSHSYRSSNRVLARTQSRHPKQQVNVRTS